MIIEINTGVFYDTEKTWYEQSQECIAEGQALMQTPPAESFFEDCEGGAKRLVWGVWETTTATGHFAMRVQRFHAYSPEKRAFLSKQFQDTVTVTVL